jgi:hypothetical protein
MYPIKYSAEMSGLVIGAGPRIRASYALIRPRKPPKGLEDGTVVLAFEVKQFTVCV